MKKLLLLPLLLTACQPPTLDEAKLDAAIEQQLRAGPIYNKAFLNFNYGDTRADVARKLEKLREADIVQGLSTDEGQTLPSTGTGYRFKEPFLLATVKWDIGTSFHNDSLTEVRLMAIEQGDPIPEYDELRAKYTQVYGAPVTAIPTQAVFVKGSQRVEVFKDKEFMRVSYENTALNKRGYLTKPWVFFDKNGNSYDSAYYKKYVMPHQVKNLDGI